MLIYLACTRRVVVQTLFTQNANHDDFIFFYTLYLGSFQVLLRRNPTPLPQRNPHPHRRHLLPHRDSLVVRHPLLHSKGTYADMDDSVERKVLSIQGCCRRGNA